MAGPNGRDQADMAHPGYVTELVQPRRPPRARIVWLVMAMVMLIALGVVALSARRRATPIGLPDIERFLVDQGSVQFTERGELAGTGDDGKPVSSSWTSNGVIRLPGEARSVLRWEHEGYVEIIVADGKHYTRAAPEKRFLSLHEWGVFDLAGADAGMRDTAPTLLAALAVRDVFDVREMIQKARDPVSTAGNTMTVQVPFATVFPLFGGRLIDVPSPDMTVGVVLTTGEGGRLDGVAIDARQADFSPAGAGDGQFRLDVRFSEWGIKTDFAAPKDLDANPQIEQARLMAAPFEVLAPTSLPSWMRLLEAIYYEPGERGLAEEDCGKAMLYYGDPADELLPQARDSSNDRFLYIDIVRTSCTTDDARITEAYSEKGAGEASAFSLGPYAGTVASYDGAATGRGLMITFTVGEVEIFVESTLSSEETWAALQTFAPLDLATQPIG